MPFRDAGSWINTALMSIRWQTFEDWELIAVDDGSADDSVALVEEVSRRDGRVRLVSSSGESGLPGALNRGLDLCRGELVARMDADDVSAPKRFELQVRALEVDPTLDGVSCGVALFPCSTLTEGARRYESWLNSLVEPEAIARERFVESPLPHPSVLLRRSILEQAGGYREQGWPEDYDLWLRLFERGARFSKIERTLFFWRDHPGRASRHQERYRRERFLDCKAHYLRRSLLGASAQWILWGAGPTGRKLAKRLDALGCRPRVFVDIDPKKVGRRPYGIPVVGPDGLGAYLEDGCGPILVAVSRWGARDLLRRELGGRGLVEGRDFWFVA